MKIDVLIPRYRGQEPAADWAINDAMLYAIAQGHDIRVPKLAGSAMADRARNLGIPKCREDADYVLFADDDMAPEKDAIHRLARYDLPVVSALCTTRELPLRVAVSGYDRERDDRCPFPDDEKLRSLELITGDYLVGAAFLLVRKSVIDQMAEYFLTAQDWLADNRRLFDRLHVRSENREKERERIEGLRRKLWDTEKMLRLFQFGTWEDETQRGEDYHFCRTLHHLGVPVAIDTGCIVSHLGPFPFSTRLMGIHDWKDVRIEA